LLKLLYLLLIYYTGSNMVDERSIRRLHILRTQMTVHQHDTMPFLYFVIPSDIEVCGVVLRCRVIIT